MAGTAEQEGGGLSPMAPIFLKDPVHAPGRSLLLFSSTPRNKTGDMPRENCQTVPVTL